MGGPIYTSISNIMRTMYTHAQDIEYDIHVHKKYTLRRDAIVIEKPIHRLISGICM